MLTGSYIRGTISKYQNGTQKEPRKTFNIGEVWNLVCCHGNKSVESIWNTFSRIVLQRIKHFWYKLAGIGLSSYLIKICLSVWRDQLANLHIVKIWISLERKEIFKNSKQHFSSYTDYVCKLKNSLDRKDAIFVIVPLKRDQGCRITCGCRRQRCNAAVVNLFRYYVGLLYRKCS